MCSNIGCLDEDFSDLPDDVGIKDYTKCKKCGENANIKLKCLDSYCKGCFLQYMVHKFRATLGKSKLISYNEKVLLCYSGGLRSSIMLHLIHSGINMDKHKKLVICPVILHIDEGFIYSIDLNERIAVCRKVYQLSEIYNIPCFICPLESIFNGDIHIPKNLQELSDSYKSSSFSTGLENVFSGISLSSQERLLSIMKNYLYQKAAVTLGCSKIFVGNCATSIAINLISSMSLGQGLQGIWQAKFCDNQLEVPILKPMRELTSKELAYYGHIFEIEVVQIQAISSKKANSIQKIAEKFVMNLQGNFSSTIFTLCKIADKIKVISDGKSCNLCESILDLEGGPSSAYASLSSSTCLVPSNSSSTSGKTFCKDECCNRCDVGERAHSAKAINICYSCQIILNEMDQNRLPESMQLFINRIQARKSMKQQLSDYLL